MNIKNLCTCVVLITLLLSACVPMQAPTSTPDPTPTLELSVDNREMTKTKFLTYQAPGISFSSFEIDYDPEVWQEQKVEGSTFRYLESVQLPRCVFHDLLGSGNGPYGEEFHFTLDDRVFSYYLNTPDEYPVEKSPQSILIYFKDPNQDFSIRWGFQVFSDYQTVDQCLGLVKGLLSNLPNNPTTTDLTPGDASGPEVVQLGDLTMEVYERILNTTGDDGNFATTAGPSGEILETRRPLRDVFSQPFSPPPLNGRQLTAEQHENDGEMTVIFKLDDEEVLSVNCGAVGPVDNLRGMWVIGKDWYAEVAHTTDPTVPNTPRGEIFMNGVSLNEQYGYDETFGFQPLDDKPFYFFAKDGQIGINYAGESHQLGFESVSHYSCCSGAAFNSKAYLTMVTFFAQGNGKEYYVELGLFSAFDTIAMDLSGAGLTVEAYWLEDGSWPDEEHIQSRPTGSLPGWVMKRHESERKALVRYQEAPLFQGKVLTAVTNINLIADATVEVRLDDEIILSVPAGDFTYSAGMDAVYGVWTHGEHWYMEMAHVEYITDDDLIKGITLGEIFRSGESLSQLFGYNETFGFQILAGEPFYFFRKGDEIGLNYAGEEVLLGFDEAAHHYCCGFGIYNPMHYENMVSFFASRDGKRYYVEAGVFK